MNLTARGRNGRTGHEEITGETPDISEYMDFDFYDWVWYWDTPDHDNSPKIGRWLGPLHRIVSDVLLHTGKEWRGGIAVECATCNKTGNDAR
jgi:hypothetical protein